MKKTTKVCVGKKSKNAPMTKREAAEEAAEVARITRAILAGKFKHNKNVRLVLVG